MNHSIPFVPFRFFLVAFGVTVLIGQFGGLGWSGPGSVDPLPVSAGGPPWGNCLMWLNSAGTPTVWSHHTAAVSGAYGNEMYAAWTLDWGDGTAPQSGGGWGGWGQATPHTYTASGDYSITLSSDFYNYHDVPPSGVEITSCSLSLPVSILIPTHRACQAEACVTMSGAGTDECALDIDCETPPSPSTHRECQSSACVVVGGAGPNQCGTSADCVAPTHRSCAGATCLNLPGPGSNTCGSDADCAPLSAACVLSASPTRLILPAVSASALSWTCINTTGCSIDQGIGSVGLSGSVTVAPTSSTIYNLTCTDAAASAGIRVFSFTGGELREAIPR